MNRTQVAFRILSSLIFTIALSALAQAQASRTWVSGVGDDVNPCSRTAPCKTFPGAISKTATNGEINCLDPGGFGALTITKSITVDCHEVFAGIVHSSINGININFDSFAGTDTRKSVRLRNLNLQGFNTGTRGIRISGGVSVTGGSVAIEDCLVDGSFGNPGRGIEDSRTGGGELFISNTTVRNNGGTGIVVLPTSGGTRIDATIDNVRVFNNAFGIVASNGSRMTVTNSIVSGNTNHAFGVEGALGASELSINNCQISSNGTGISQVAGGTVRVANSTITNNITNGTVGTVFSYGNNRFSGNGGSSAVTAVGGPSSDNGQS